jgi:hypothetical protein
MEKLKEAKIRHDSFASKKLELGKKDTQIYRT